MPHETRGFNPEAGKEADATYVSRINLKFFRHDDKENDKTKTDDEVALTSAGRQHAKEQSFLSKITQAVAFGSPRRRTQETAALHMAGKQEDITGEETLEELRVKIDAGMAYGSKIAVDKRLNFDIDPASAYGQAAMAAFKKGEYMKFLVADSDRVAAETGDKNSTTFSRQAAAIAGIIEKYLTIAPRFEKLVEQDGLEKDMQRMLGSHQGVGESFLAKVIEKMAGKAEEDVFVAALRNQGFGFSEGFAVEITTKVVGAEPTVHIRFEKNDAEGNQVFSFDKDVPLSVIKEIAAEGK